MAATATEGGGGGMPGWTPDMHAAAEQELNSFVTEFQTAIATWRNNTAAGSATAEQGHAHVEDVLRRWRSFTERLQAASLMATANGTVMERLTTALGEVAELQTTLAELQSRAGSATARTGAVFPTKITESPYINLFGLNRVFRPETRMALLILSIVLGVAVVTVIGFLIWRVVGGSGLSSLFAGNFEEASSKFRVFAQSYQA